MAASSREWPGRRRGGVISPLLANLFLHYAFDMWMARALWSALGDRLAACKLVLHPVKTKVVYCKDVNRRGEFPVISFDFLGFQFRARKTMWRKDGECQKFCVRGSCDGC